MNQLLFAVGVFSVIFSSCAGNQVKTSQEPAAPVFERKIAEDVPSFVSDAVKNAPQDALVGVGAAKMAMVSMSQSIAVTRAQADIARQVSQIFIQMVHNYSVTSESDPETVQLFQERVTVTISKAQLSGVSILARDFDDDGNFWVVAIMNREPVSDTISNARNQAKDDFPQMSSFDIAAMLPDVIANAVKEEITVAR